MALNFIIKPFWIFGIDRTVQNTVPFEEYGMYFTLFNFSILFSIFLDLGLTNYNNRNVSQNHNLFYKYFTGLLSVKVLLSVLYFIITFFVGYWFGYASEHFYILLLLTINQCLISLILFLRSNVSGLQLYGIDSFLSVLDKFLMTIFCGILLWGNVLNSPFTIIHFLLSQTLAYIITALTVFFLLFFRLKKISFQFNSLFIWATIKQTFPYAFLTLVMAFYYRIDAVMLENLISDGVQQVAIYAQAYRLLDAASQIGVLFAGLLLPMFALMISNNQSILDLLRLSFSLLFIPSSVFAVFCLFYSDEIMSLLYNHTSNSSPQILTYLMFCFVAIAGTYIYGTLLTSKGKLFQLNVIAVVGLVLNVVLNLVLIPKFKAEGAAISGLITQWVIMLSQILVCSLIFEFKVNYAYFFKVVSILIVVFLISFFSKHQNLGLLNALLIVVSSSSVLMFITKIVKAKEILQLMKKNRV